MCFEEKLVIAKVALSVSPKIQLHSLTRETIHGQKEHCIICRSLQGSPLSTPRLPFPQNSMSQTELFAPLPVLNILGLVWVNLKELGHKVHFNQLPNRKALITPSKASFVQMTTVEHDESKQEKKNPHRQHDQSISPAQCKQQADNTASFSCFLKLTSLSVKPQYHIYTDRVRGRQLACTRMSAKPLLLLLMWNLSLMNKIFGKLVQGKVDQSVISAVTAPDQSSMSFFTTCLTIKEDVG